MIETGVDRVLILLLIFFESFIVERPDHASFCRVSYDKIKFFTDKVDERLREEVVAL